MANQDKKKQQKESKLTCSLRSNGYLFPITIEQVNYLEEHHQDIFQSIPSDLTSAADILARGAITFASKSQKFIIDENTETSLAQAAREGKQISEEVKQQMRLDRLKANEPDNDDSIKS